ncbi:allatostatin-A receptor [Episyrphus balteatus]|uniref:allatostatin-A receptor n=1 Tax=Episyrphus balteatus TaxID=286459 RepID=UPI00248513C7|nr:allatostatin-A receptor [Episyrphus balteatus]
MNFTEHNSAADEMFNGTTAAIIDTQIEDLVSVIVPVFFGLIAITGFLGNSLVIFVVLANPQMRSTTNLLIMNLAVADLLFVIFCIPFTAADYMFYIWPFGEPWCCFVQYMIVATVLVSIYTLVLMSVDRFLAVVHPIWSRAIRTESTTKVAIFTVWTVIVVASVPVFFAHGLEELPDVHHRWLLCRFDMENDFISWSTYHITFMIASYFLPLIIISGLYIRMITSLWQQGAGVKMSEESQRGRKRVTRLVVVVVIAFASLWFPIQIIMVLKSLDLYQATSTWTVVVQIISHLLAYTSSCINPVLYAFLSENFRKAFHKAVNCSPRYQSCNSHLPPPRRTSNARTSTTSM